MLNKINYNNNKFVYLLLRSVAEDTKELDATNLTLDDNNEETFKGFKEIFCVCFINKKNPWNISKVPLRPQDREWENLVSYPVETRSLYTFCENKIEKAKLVFNTYFDEWINMYKHNISLVMPLQIIDVLRK